MYTEKDFLEEFANWNAEYGKYYEIELTKGDSIIKEHRVATPIDNRYVPFSFSISQNEVVILTVGKYLRINEEDFPKEYKKGSIFFREVFASISNGSLTENEFYFGDKPVKVVCNLSLAGFGNYRFEYNLVSLIDSIKVKLNKKGLQESILKYQPLPKHRH
jgi:hypothetical protein